MGWAQISVITELMRPPPSAETKSVMMASPPHNVGVAHLHSEFALPLLNYDCLEQRDTSVLRPRMPDFTHSGQTAQLLGHREHTRSRRTAQPDLQAILIRSCAVLNPDVFQAQMGRLERRFNGQHGELPAIDDQHEEAGLSRTGEASLQRFYSH